MRTASLLSPTTVPPRKLKVTLGLNVDHVATVREARGGVEPCVIDAACEGIKGGASGITAHLREDRRHIQDNDIRLLKKYISVPLNLELSVNPRIVSFASRARPAKACLVPEKRQELTTEGGLDVVRGRKQVAHAVQTLQESGVLVSLFIDPIGEQIKAAAELEADFIELHTGRYANTSGEKRRRELCRLHEAACLAHSLGLGVNAGHGLNYDNVIPIAKLPHVQELNIGHAIVSRAVFTGLRAAVCEMCVLIQQA